MFRKVLFPTDLSRYADAVLGCVVDLKAAGMREVILLHVVHQDEAIRGSTVDLDRLQRLKVEAQSHLDAMGRSLKGEEVAVKARVEVGVPAREIVRVAEEEDVSLIAMGSHGRGVLQGFLLGSVSERVLHTSSRPVWVERLRVVEENGGLKECHRWCAHAFEKVLCPTDWSDPATYALEYAKELRFAGAREVVVLHVQEPVIMQQRGSEQLAEFDRRDRERLEQAGKEFEELGFKATLRLEHGAPLARILEVAEEEDVCSIIMGSHGRSMAAEMVLGSVAENVVRRSRRPVLVVRRGMVP